MRGGISLSRSGSEVFTGGTGCTLRKFRRVRDFTVNDAQGIFCPRFNQHQAGDVRGVRLCEKAGEPTTVGMSNEHEWSFLTRLFKQGVEFPNLLAQSAGTWAEVAPARASAVIRTHARESRNKRLNQAPVDRKITGAGFENDCRPREDLFGPSS